MKKHVALIMAMMVASLFALPGSASAVDPYVAFFVGGAFPGKTDITESIPGASVTAQDAKLEVEGAVGVTI